MHRRLQNTKMFDFGVINLLPFVRIPQFNGSMIHLLAGSLE